MWRGEPFLNNMHKQHFSAGRAELQISDGRAEVSSVGICSIRLWKFAIVTSARHGLNYQLSLAH